MAIQDVGWKWSLERRSPIVVGGSLTSTVVYYLVIWIFEWLLQVQFAAHMCIMGLYPSVLDMNIHAILLKLQYQSRLWFVEFSLYDIHGSVESWN